jgi:hypothetical protein
MGGKLMFISRIDAAIHRAGIVAWMTDYCVRPIRVGSQMGYEQTS